MEQSGEKCIENARKTEVSALTGEYKHSIDNKGRLFIPAKLRDELGDVFYITLSMDDCLSVYSAESWKEFSDKVNAMSYIKQRKMRPLFAYAAKCELDNHSTSPIVYMSVAAVCRSLCVEYFAGSSAAARIYFLTVY